MTAGRLVSEAVGNAAPGATTATIAVPLVGETDQEAREAPRRG